MPSGSARIASAPTSWSSPRVRRTRPKSALLSGEPTQFLMDRSILDRVRAIEGVKSATPQLFVKPTSFTCCFNVDVFLVAFDPDTDFTVKPWLEKNLNRKLGSNEIITGRNVPVIAGDKIPFFGTTFTVAGTMEATGMDFFDRAVFMSLDAAYQMAENSKTKAIQPIEIGRDQISTVLVQVKDDFTPDRAAIRIEHDISGVKALVSDTIISTVRKQLSGLIKAILIISVILWAIVLLIMAFAFYMIVNERRREIGILRAMGANRGHIAAIILNEAVLLSATGGAAGIVLGYVLLISFKDLMLHYLKLPYLFPATPELIMLTAGALLVSIMYRPDRRVPAVDHASESGALRSNKECGMKPLFVILFMSSLLVFSCADKKEQATPPVSTEKNLFEELRDQTVQEPEGCRGLVPSFRSL